MLIVETQDAYALAQANIAPIENIALLLKALQHERDYTVWCTMGGILNTVSRFLSDGSTDSESSVWSIPLIFATSGSLSTEAVLFEQKVQTFALPLIPGIERNWVKV